MSLTRRRMLGHLAAVGTAAFATRQGEAQAAPNSWSLSTFECDITPPVGHPLLGTSFAPARSILDPLAGRGLVLTGPQEPLVLVCLDWCELRNDAFARWRQALAAAAGTSVSRVLVHTIHQHDAPYFDLTADRLLRASTPGGSILDPDFHEECVQRAARALQDSLPRRRTVTHVGTGQAQVRELASNRRVEEPGRVSFRRYSRCTDPLLRSLPDGEIDSWLKTIAFYSGSEELAALSVYACHPMSYYGGGEVSGDFPNLARRIRHAAQPTVFQLYGSGCCGDVTAGKYNDGSRELRTQFAEKLAGAMAEADRRMQRHELKSIQFRHESIVLPHSELPQMSADALRQRLNDANVPLSARAQAALGLSSLERGPDGHVIEIPRIDFGAAQLLLLPAESFVAYQRFAQQVRPDDFVVTLGFGESAPGYIPTEAAFREGFREEHGYTWVRPGAEDVIKAALKKLLAQ